MSSDDVKLSLAASTPCIPSNKHRKIDSRFSQMDKHGTVHASYVRFNQRFLAIKKQKQQSILLDDVIDLCFINAKPIQIKSTPWSYSIAAAMIIICSVGAYSLLSFTPILLILSLILSVLLALKSYKKRIHQYQFLSLTGKVAVFSINALHPNKQLVRAFLIDLQDNIQQANNLLPKGKQLIPVAIPEMRRLLKAGFINQQAYDQLRDTLLSNPNKKKAA